MSLSCDLFCAVVDNLGDAGVCWRLARQLAAEKGWQMRLWIDDPSPLDLLAPDHDAAPVEVRRWQGDFAMVEPAEIVIEAFACELPEAFVAAMAARPRPPVWINLEYLSAEDWVAGCHGLPSPHPKLPLTKHFFFPGFGPGTGGLILESGADFGRPGLSAALTVSLFCYDNPALPALLDIWADGAEPMVCRVADGLPRRQVAAWLDGPFSPGTDARRGALALHALPFLPQTDYDRLLGSCNLNFVRGEDSFVRAQWARRPFVWQPYLQAGDAHRLKLEAFLARYGSGLAEAAAVHGFWRAWNGLGDVGSTWPAFRAALPALLAHAGPWAGKIAAAGDLATNLETFCRARL
ncbi:MAG: elongation factor P maturation arginine rhamnosyltransferase EarP [Candidatus Nitricoxidivorans perseverans]|uniref:Protein-arginine rhamnosyltransferase n=1 Tax=Candidatus Nitricoxidivorans perseverans TaxID=2975601 RepID=A0AA49FN79_9PROT|nr:MAG: elongation factor P maturation arginine rhamnosyltransferase EarP [Candidatus Nitricoxidivorans perseverans]